MVNQANEPKAGTKMSEELPSDYEIKKRAIKSVKVVTNSGKFRIKVNGNFADTRDFYDNRIRPKGYTTVIATYDTLEAANVRRDELRKIERKNHRAAKRNAWVEVASDE